VAQITRTRSFQSGAKVLLFCAFTSQCDPSKAGWK